MTTDGSEHRSARRSQEARAEAARRLIAELRPAVDRAKAAGLPVVAYCLETAIVEAEKEIEAAKR